MSAILSASGSIAVHPFRTRRLGAFVQRWNRLSRVAFAGHRTLTLKKIREDVYLPGQCAAFAHLRFLTPIGCIQDAAR